MKSDINKGTTHIFSQRFSKRKFYEYTVTGIFRFFTYLVIVLAGYLFLDIAYNGSKAVFTKDAPFINIQFLTEKPQTLHVFEPADIDSQLKEAKAEVLKIKTKIKTSSNLNYELNEELTLKIDELNKEIKSLDMLRKEASPAKVLELNIVAKVADLDTLSKSGASS